MAEIFTMLIISVVANVMVILFANGWTEKKGSSLNRTAHCNERDPPPEVALWGGGVVLPMAYLSCFCLL